MEEPTSLVMPFIKLLVELGLPGLIIACLAFFCWRLDVRNHELNNTLLQIIRETVKASEASTASINRLADLLTHGRSGRSD